MLFLRLIVSLLIVGNVVSFQHSTSSSHVRVSTMRAVATPTGTAELEPLSAKKVTKDIMAHFGHQKSAADDEVFAKRLQSTSVLPLLDGMHMLTLLFQSARSRKPAASFFPITLVKEKLQVWDREWNERDISAFMYGIQSLACISADDSALLELAAAKIQASTAKLSSRAIGNALYGMHKITSDTQGVPELCAALAEKIGNSVVDLNGQDIGIGLYGLQGMSASVPAISRLIEAIATRVTASEADLDAQALSNALYGLQVLLPFS